MAKFVINLKDIMDVSTRDYISTNVDMFKSTTPGPKGTGITSIARTAGDGSEGTTDTYTITYDDTSTSTFNVTNGTAGVISHITRTVGTGAAGTTDTYTAYADLAETQPLGTFNVYNGVDGLDSIGDMSKSTYDTNNNGKVDSAENADMVNGLTVETAVPVGAVFTDTVYDDTGVLKDTDIGISVQSYDINTVIDSMYVHTDNNFTNTLKSKLDSLSNYTHPTADGSLHIPATGTTNNGKVLMAGATAGTLNWTTLAISNTTGLQTALDDKATTASVTTLSNNVGATDTIYVTVFNAALA